MIAISCGVRGEWCVPRRPGGRGGISPREPRFSDYRASLRSGVSSRDQKFFDYHFVVNSEFLDEIPIQAGHCSPSLNVGCRPLVAVSNPLAKRRTTVEVGVDLLVSDLVVLPVPVQIVRAFFDGGHLLVEDSLS